MRLIPLNKGMFAKVDDEDFDKVNQYRWQVVAARCGTANPYARTSIRKGNKRKTVLMHRFILGTESGTLDHKDGDSLNNQKSNLRLADRSENGRNRRIQPHSAPYKGVAYFPITKKWVAYICLNFKKVHLGYFKTPELAAKTYDAMAIKHFGEFARTNQQMGVL